MLSYFQDSVYVKESQTNVGSKVNMGVSGKEDLPRLCRMFIHYDDNAMVGSKVMHYSVIIIKKGIGEGEYDENLSSTTFSIQLLAVNC